MLGIRATLMLSCQHFRFSEKFYIYYNQRTQIIYEKTNIFYLISDSTLEALLLFSMVVQVLLMLLLKAVIEVIPCYE